MRDALSGVIDHHRELVREQSIGALHDEVADFALEPLFNLPLEAIPKADGLVSHEKTPRARLAPRQRATAADPRVHALATGAGRADLEFFARAAAGVGLAAGDEPRERCFIKGGTLALSHDLAVPFETVALECSEHRGAGWLAAPRLVDVLDPYQPFSADGASVAVARHCGDQRTEMQRPGWRRGEAAAVRDSRVRHLALSMRAPKRAASKAPPPADCGLQVQYRRKPPRMALG